jgi:hypothetical protein
MDELRGDRALGFRADTKSVYWAAVERGADSLLLLGQGVLEAPGTFGEGEALAYFAKETVTLIRQHLPAQAWIREAEGIAQTKRAYVAKRSRIEGVVLAAATMTGVRVLMGPLASITKRVKPTTKGTKKASAKQYIDSENSTFRGIDLSSFRDNLREAIVSAAAALA